jgi:hypothetical protein
MAALMRWLRGLGPVVVIGPVWLAETVSAETPTLLLAEPEERARAQRAVKRAAAARRSLGVAVAGVDLPVGPFAMGALVIEGAATLDHEALMRWMATLIPALRPGGRLLAFDAAADDPSVETALTKALLAAALRDIVQERPRSGVLLTVGTAPEAAITSLRFSEPARP